MPSTQASPSLVDDRALKAQSHPIRAEILNILSEGPSSPSRIRRRMNHRSLELVSYHVKILREIGLIELVETRRNGGRKEHIYRATKRQFFTLEQWQEVDPGFQDPIVGTILRQISEDAGRSATEGRFNEKPDRHLSRSPVELDSQGWTEVVGALEEALLKVLAAHDKSKLRAQASGESLMAARVVIMQFPIGRDDSVQEKG